jgi:hypothetical protein
MKKTGIAFLVVLGLLYWVVAYYFRNVPFFWDSAFYSEAASFYTRNGGRLTNCPEQLDNATAPVFSYYLFVCWTLFGKTLLVSHFAIVPPMLLASHFYLKIVRCFLSAQYVMWSVLFWLASPIICSQFIFMGQDLVMLCFFLGCLYAILFQKFWLYVICSSLLVVYSPRGLLLFISLVGIDCFFAREHKWQDITKRNIVAVVAISAWFVFHYLQTNWLLFVPSHASTDEHILLIGKMPLHLFYIVWRLFDLGQVVLWVVVVFILSFVFKTKVKDKNIVTLFSFLLIPLFVSIGAFVLISNPIASRYFIFVYPVMVVLSLYFFQHYFAFHKTNLILFAILMFQISGNFWMYPQRFGNAWDASLKTLPFFDMRDKMDEFIVSQKIIPSDVGTQFPLIDDKKFTHLTTDSFKYQNVWKGPLSKYKYFLYSNIINTDIPEQFEDAKKNWKPLKQLKKGFVELTLFENPNFSQE